MPASPEASTSESELDSASSTSATFLSGSSGSSSMRGFDMVGDVDRVWRSVVQGGGDARTFASSVVGANWRGPVMCEHPA